MDLSDSGSTYVDVMTDSCSFKELLYPSSYGSFGKLTPVFFDKNIVNVIIRVHI